MPYAFVQQASGSGGSGSVSSIASTDSPFASAHVTGNSWIWVVQYDGAPSPVTVTVTDSRGNTHVPIGTLHNATEQAGMAWGLVANTVAGAASTVTASFASNVQFPAIYVAEFSGLDTSAIFTSGESVAQRQVTVATTADALTSTATPTLAAQPALVFGFSHDWTAGTDTPAAGTGFTGLSPVWGFPGTGSAARAEHKRVTSTAGVAATFTAAVGTSSFRTIVMVLKEATAGGGAMTGSVPLALAVTGALTGRGALNGSIANAINVTGTLVDATPPASPAFLGQFAQQMRIEGWYGGNYPGQVNLIESWWSPDIIQVPAASSGLVGNVGLALGVTGVLTGLGALVGSIPLALNVTGAATGRGALNGAIPLALNVAGSPNGIGVLAGSIPLSLGVTGTATGRGALTGNLALALAQVGALTGSGALSGSVALALAVAGNLSAAGGGALNGAVSMSISPAGALTGSGALTGAIPLSLAVTGAPSGLGTLTGSVPLSLAVAGNLSAAGGGALNGAIALALAVTGTMSGSGALTGALALLVSVAGTLSNGAASALTGNVPMVVTTVGALTGRGALTGSVSAVITPAGSLTGRGALAGLASMGISVTGLLTGYDPGFVNAEGRTVRVSGLRGISVGTGRGTNVRGGNRSGSVH